MLPSTLPLVFANLATPDTNSTLLVAATKELLLLAIPTAKPSTMMDLASSAQKEPSSMPKVFA